VKKHFFIFFLLLFWSTQSFSQFKISTDLREDYIWSDSLGEWMLVNSNDQEFTLIEFDTLLPILIHTTPTMTSRYIINSNEYDQEHDHTTFDLTSDVGNHYTMIIDINNNNVRFVGESQGTTTIVRHNIKKFWKEE